MHVKPENYILIPGWARTELNLKGNELLVFGLIHGFTQDGDNWFEGSAQYVADWIGSTKKTALAALSKLVERGLIEKQKVEQRGGVTFCNYRCNFFPTGVNDAGNTGVNSSSTGVNFTPQIIVNKSSKKKEIGNLIQDFTEDEGLRGALGEFVDMRAGLKKPVSVNGMKRLLNKLSKLAQDTETQTAIVLKAVDSCWSGFFPLKDDDRIPAKEFVKPTKQECRDFRRAEDLNVNGDDFFEYYDPCWERDNGAKITDWRQVMREWSERDTAKGLDKRPKVVESPKSYRLVESMRPDLVGEGKRGEVPAFTYGAPAPAPNPPSRRRGGTTSASDLFGEMFS